MLRPLRDLILVRPCSPVRMVGMLHIPDSQQSARNQTFHHATVLAAGPLVKQAVTGKSVFISDLAGDELQIDGERVFLLREKDIVGISP
jgi:co-chaperonin GroES (HSP10)